MALGAGDTAGLERLAAYMVRCPFSLDRIISVSDDGQVLYRAEKVDCQPFPILGNDKLLRGISRNFEVFDPLDFLAEITQHIPDPGMQMIRYYGWYSNKMRGQRAKVAGPATTGEEVDIDGEDTPYRKLARMRWGALLKRVYEVDPFRCPSCGAQMRIVAFIERRDQPDVVERILKHCGLWDRPASRAPPAAAEAEQLVLELEYVDTDSRPKGDGLPPRQQRNEVQWQLPHGPLSSAAQDHARSLPGFGNSRLFLATSAVGCALCPGGGAAPGAQGTSQTPIPLKSLHPHPSALRSCSWPETNFLLVLVLFSQP